MQDSSEYVDLHQYIEHHHQQQQQQQHQHQQLHQLPRHQSNTTSHVSSGINDVNGYHQNHNHHQLGSTSFTSSISPPLRLPTTSHFPYVGGGGGTHHFTQLSLPSTTPFANADIGTRNNYDVIDAVFDADLVAAAACYYGTTAIPHASYSGLPTAACNLSATNGVGGNFGGFVAGCGGGGTSPYYQLAAGSVAAMSAKTQRKPVVSGRDDKFCGVCGDRALSYNFDAISCESCKAFFRRNAPKGLENFKCPYDERCRMDVSNRRFCKRCRLNKCFQIGMRKEYILSDEEKAQKRQKIEANRLLRSKSEQHHRKQSAATAASGPTRSSSFSMSSGEISYGDYNEETSPVHVPDFTCSGGTAACVGAEVTSQTVALQPEDARAIEDLLDAYRMSLETQQQQQQQHNTVIEQLGCNGSYDGRSASIADPADGIDASGSFWTKDLSVRSFELLGGRRTANDVIVATSGGSGFGVCNQSVSGSTSGGTANNLADLVNIAELSMRRVIAMTKQIAAFRLLPQPDQICLLKSGSIELLILRSVLTFDADKQHFLDPGDDERTTAMNVNELRRAEEECGGCIEGGMFDDHMRFIRSLVVDLRADETTLILLLVVSLFSPDRDSLINRDYIADEQERYCLLLKRYLESRHAAPAARIMFARLIAKLADVRTLNEVHSHVLLKLNPDGIQPLMKEVLDLRPVSMPAAMARESLGGVTVGV